MKYFTGALWRDINSGDKTIRATAEAKWKKNLALYEKKFDKEKKRFPDHFIEIYESKQGFHDFKIKKITMAMEDWANRFCTIGLSDGETVYELVFQKVSAFVVNFPSLCTGQWNELRWGYLEIGYKDSKLTISVLCDDDKEFTIDFKAVTVTSKADGSP